MTNNQALLFLIFSLNGIIIGFLFDFFRILRKSFKTSNIVTYIQDILFWILASTIILYSVFKFCNGELRLFIFISIALGVTIYMLLFSKIFIKINIFIINIITKIIKVIFIKPIEFIIKLMKKLIFKPVIFISINIRKILSSFKINFKIMFKKKKKRVI